MRFVYVRFIGGFNGSALKAHALDLDLCGPIVYTHTRPNPEQTAIQGRSGIVFNGIPYRKKTFQERGSKKS